MNRIMLKGLNNIVEIVYSVILVSLIFRMKKRVTKKVIKIVRDKAAYPKAISISAINPRNICVIKKEAPIELSEILLYFDVFFTKLRVMNSFDAVPYRIP